MVAKTGGSCQAPGAAKTSGPNNKLPAPASTAGAPNHQLSTAGPSSCDGHTGGPHQPPGTAPQEPSGPIATCFQAPASPAYVSSLYACCYTSIACL
ncbi:UNVERIFIED_CONTAM: hypothetical protein FKN15_031536 [Acipenser sinensis]